LYLSTSVRKFAGHFASGILIRGTRESLGERRAKFLFRSDGGLRNPTPTLGCTLSKIYTTWNQQNKTCMKFHFIGLHMIALIDKSKENHVQA